MDRFGNSKLRIVWISVCLLVAGLVMGAMKRSPDQASVILLGAEIPITFGLTEASILENMARLLYGMVPMTMLLVGFFPLVASYEGSSSSHRVKNLAMGMGMGLVHGLFYSQVMLLPVWAASFRLTGHPLPGLLLRADFNAIVLGIQLLLWSAILGRLLRSSAGLALLLTFGLKEVGAFLDWGVKAAEFLGAEGGVPTWAAKSLNICFHLLPSGQVPGDPLSWSALPLSLGTPLLMAFLLGFLPSGKVAKSSPSKPRKAKA